MVVRKDDKRRGDRLTLVSSIHSLTPHRLSRLASHAGMGSVRLNSIQARWTLSAPATATTHHAHSRCLTHIHTTYHHQTPQVLSQQQQVRALHATRRQENVVVGGLVVAGTALALQYGLRVRGLGRVGRIVAFGWMGMFWV